MALEHLDFERVKLSQVPTLMEGDFDGTTLIVPGGGAWTSKFNEPLPSAVSQAAKVFRSVIVLPSEFENKVDCVHKALICPNVFPFAREVESYGELKRYCKASLSLDPAVWAFDFQGIAGGGRARNDDNLGQTLLALRTDSASLLSEENLKTIDSNDDISITTDNLSTFLQSIAAADTVVSDRLHVVVAATMLGKTVRFFDPYNHKISRYVRYNFGQRFNETVQQRDGKWLLANRYVRRVKINS
jgi:hypothetical protein